MKYTFLFCCIFLSSQALAQDQPSSFPGVSSSSDKVLLFIDAEPTGAGLIA